MGFSIYRNFNHHLIKQGYRQLCTTRHWTSVVAVMLTLRQAYPAHHRFKNSVDEADCKHCFKQFMKKLNRKAFGAAYRKRAKQLRVIPVLEKSEDGRWHYHCSIEPPAHMEFADFEKLIRGCWKDTLLGYDQIIVKPNADKGWADYILKSRSKGGLETWSDAIDLNSLRNWHVSPRG
jgi:hypothetical protein